MGQIPRDEGLGWNTPITAWLRHQFFHHDYRIKMGDDFHAYCTNARFAILLMLEDHYQLTEDDFIQGEVSRELRSQIWLLIITTWRASARATDLEEDDSDSNATADVNDISDVEEETDEDPKEIGRRGAESCREHKE